MIALRYIPDDDHNGGPVPVSRWAEETDSGRDTSDSKRKILIQGPDVSRSGAGTELNL